MDLTAGPDQELLRKSARDLLEAECPVEKMIEIRGRGAFDERLWRRAAELGWAGVLVYEPLGHELAVQAAVELLEQVGRVLAPIPLASSVVAAWLAAAAKAPDSVVEDFASGSERPALPAATRAGLVRDATSATGFLLIQRGRLEWIAASSDGVKVTPRLTAGRLREASVDLSAASPRDLAGVPPALAERLRTLQILLEAAEMTGACERVLELAVHHVCTRMQFGRPLGSFQAVQHRMADMLTDLDGIRWSCRRAAAEMDSGRDAGLLVARLAVLVKENSQRVVASCLQVHGGVGFIRDHPLHAYFGRQKATELSFGLAGYHRERIAAAILD